MSEGEAKDDKVYITKQAFQFEHVVERFVQNASIPRQFLVLFEHHKGANHASHRLIGLSGQVLAKMFVKQLQFILLQYPLV